MNRHPLDHVRVLPRHVLEGIPGDACLCAVALALREQLGDPAATIEVDTDIRVWQFGAGEFYADVPPEMAEFIDRFDAVTGGADRSELVGLAADELLQWHLDWERPSDDD